jgi:hypothetical protein
MTRRLLALLATLAATVGIAAFNAGNAAATGTTFGCRIAPGTEFNFYDVCHNTKPASTYGVAFMVQNPSPGSTYSWSVPANYQSKISAGCTSTSASCNVSVPSYDQDITVDVAVTVGGVTTWFSSTAVIMAYCGTNYC